MERTLSDTLDLQENPPYPGESGRIKQFMVCFISFKDHCILGDIFFFLNFSFLG